MTHYVHGYGTPEQQRLVEQAEHWRFRLIRDGTQLEPGTRLLEVGCGVGAVLSVLGQEFPGVRLTGVDIEPKQLAFAREHLARTGVEGDRQHFLIGCTATLAVELTAHEARQPHG